MERDNMAQVNVSLVATDNQEKSITLLVGQKRIEYFLGGRFYDIAENIRNWLSNDWNNYVVSRCTECAEQIEVESRGFGGILPQKPKSRRKKAEDQIVMTDHKNVPSAEYPFTVIAATAKGVSWDRQREYFKTVDEAIQQAGEVFEANKGGNFELAIVQVVDVVRPKPTVQLMSTFKQVNTIEHQNGANSPTTAFDRMSAKSAE
jgi:hypothetical protein